MRALLCEEYGSVDELRLSDIPAPSAGPGEVLVGVRAAALGIPDVLIVQGRYQMRPELPFTPGGEGAGEVLAVGAGVSDFAPGDAVVLAPGRGMFAEQVVIPADRLFHAPDNLDHAESAGICSAYLTALHALRQRGRLREGDTLLVLGAGGAVGAAAVALGCAFGARVIAAASSDEKLAVARKQGAAATINYSDGDFRATLKEVSGSGGISMVFDPVGGSITEAALRSLAPEGRYLVVGFAAGDIPAPPLNLALLKELDIIGVHLGAFRERAPERAEANRRELWDLLETGRIRPLPGKRFPLDDWKKAFHHLMERRATGRIILIMDENSA